jgi:hypothetical protein
MVVWYSQLWASSSRIQVKEFDKKSRGQNWFEAISPQVARSTKAGEYTFVYSIPHKPERKCNDTNNQNVTGSFLHQFLWALKSMFSALCLSGTSSFSDPCAPVLLLLPGSATLCYLSWGTSVPLDSGCDCVLLPPQVPAVGLALLQVCLLCVKRRKTSLAPLYWTPLVVTQAGLHVYHACGDFK